MATSFLPALLLAGVANEAKGAGRKKREITNYLTAIGTAIKLLNYSTNPNRGSANSKIITNDTIILLLLTCTVF